MRASIIEYVDADEILGITLNNTIRLSRLALLSSVCALSVVTFDTSLAQSSSTQSGAQPLPPVVVNQPAAASPCHSCAEPHAACPHRRRAASGAAPRQTNVFVESPRGPIQGYVANRSSTGTKTNTPINETPQAISVIGAEQIRDQRRVASTTSCAMRPACCGRHLRLRLPQRLVPDPRLQVRRQQRVPRRPAAVLHLLCELEAAALQHGARGNSARPVGYSVRWLAARAASSTSSARCRRPSRSATSRPASTIRQRLFRLRHQHADQAGSGQWRALHPHRRPGAERRDADRLHAEQQLLHRAVGDLEAGRRYHADDSGLGIVQRDPCQGFLPYVGTVTNAPFGRIGTSFFASEPNFDKFKREQEMLGYQFERNLSDSVTFRQNARFAHVDVNYTVSPAAVTPTDDRRSVAFYFGHAVSPTRRNG
jgi:hypothetical protein